VSNPAPTRRPYVQDLKAVFPVPCSKCNAAISGSAFRTNIAVSGCGEFISLRAEHCGQTVEIRMYAAEVWDI
jgi:hypothetical protein